MIKKLLKRNFLIIFLALAAFATALPAPVETYPANIYVNRICLIFCFMAAAAGLEEGGIYLLIHAKMRAKLSPRAAYFLILFIAYALSAALSPYAVVILTAPLLLRLFDNKTLFFAIPIMAAAAVFGGFLSPVSSFQNVFLTFTAKMPPEELFFAVLPYSLIGLFIAVGVSLPVPKLFSQYEGLREIHPEPVYISVFLILIIITTLAVGDVFDSIAAFVSVCLVIVILEPKLVKKPLYSCLLMLFLISVIAWNITRMDLISLPDNPYFAVITLSNIISAENAAPFLYDKGISSDIIAAAANIGSAGFVLASPALIAAYAYSVSYENAKPIRSLVFFASQGVIITAVFTALYFVLPK
jgi:hypothetical protein